MPTRDELYPLPAASLSRIRAWGSRMLLWTHERNFESHIRLIIELLCCFVAALFFPGERRGAIGSGIGHALSNLCLGFSVHGGIERLCLGGFSIRPQSLSALYLPFCTLPRNV